VASTQAPDHHTPVSVVTGAAGFVGGALVRRLLADGDEVRAIVLPNDALAGELRRAAAAEPRLRVVSGDITDTASIAPAFEGADRVFHTAALVHAWAPFERFHRVNVGGTRNVAEVALAAGVTRLVALSTSDVFGLPRGTEVFDESSPLRRWHEPYADTKIEAEQWLWRFHRDSGMPVSVIYPGWVYGPGDRAFFPGLADAIAAGSMLFWYRGARLPFVYIDNLVDACLLASATPSAVGRGYIVYDSQEIAMEELCGRIAAAIGARPPRLHIPYSAAHAIASLMQIGWRLSRRATPPPLRTVDVKAFGMQWFFSNARARRELGWDPRVGFEEGLALALEDLTRRRRPALDIAAEA
jgi:nucleoside-diphosphate-sugar epimerase